ncbi:hypothetical protein LGH70_08810 [Hymenobacter sp. BT635]|uniref:Uncharacterized protein n=1 Tax=Hymenobacter nitidus TaxID=2880929 RepID=A0ABS8AF89_9BACT|nr:hypothetical protein [Hymenobacter nitidus]MCB2377679.1 hypothetical protein [Hymenobacter nitidus]
MSTFDGNEGTIVNQTTAAGMTHNYRECPDDTKPVYNAQFFGALKLKALMDDCGDDFMGLRIYNGIDESGNPTLVLVGVKADQNDMYERIMLASGPRCPNCCDSSSPLNA